MVNLTLSWHCGKLSSSKPFEGCERISVEIVEDVYGEDWKSDDFMFKFVTPLMVNQTNLMDLLGKFTEHNCWDDIEVLNISVEH